MGASAKRKREKQKDFQKPKLKVGKAKAKADNFTNTSFKSKAITLATQSLHTSAPSTTYLFTHHLSLLTHHSATTRKESLSYLKTHLPAARSATASTTPNAICNLPTTSSLVSSLLPLILDPSTSVRAQLLALLTLLPHTHLTLHTRKILLFVNSAMTHISSDIRADSTKFLDWLLGASREEVFSAGGWGVCLRGLCGCLGFNGVVGGGGGSSFIVPKVQDGKIALPHLAVLTKVLEAGLVERVDVEGEVGVGDRRRRPDGLHVSYEAHKLPSRPNVYASLGLFDTLGSVSRGGGLKDREPEDRDSRISYLTGGAGRGVFDSLVLGLGRLKKGGGEMGRAAGKALVVLEAADREGVVE
ncbi:Rix1 complex component [Tuber brumale]|nr:Rix1 complex component [Tuber brumale]